MNESLREELKTMAAEDRRLRQELLDSGELGDSYSPRMEALHRKNASRLKQIIVQHGWPDRELVGEEGTLAAWLIAQHAIGDPEFQRHALKLIQEKVSQGKVPAAQQAYLFDRVAMHEGRAQKYGTQSIPCSDGKYRRWQTEDPETLNDRRVSVGMPPVGDDPAEEKPTAKSLAEYEHWLKGYKEWLRKTGWRDS
jgi:hypothetical protein